MIGGNFALVQKVLVIELSHKSSSSFLRVPLWSLLFWTSWVLGSLLKFPVLIICYCIVWRYLSWKDFGTQIFFSLWEQSLHLNVSALSQSFSHGLTPLYPHILIVVCYAVHHKVLNWADYCCFHLYLTTSEGVCVACYTETHPNLTWDGEFIWPWILWVFVK